MSRIQDRKNAVVDINAAAKMYEYHIRIACNLFHRFS